MIQLFTLIYMYQYGKLMAQEKFNPYTRVEFFIPALIKIFAIYAFFVEHMQYNHILSTIFALIISFMPIVGEIMFIIGAIYGWGMEWYYAVLIQAGMVAVKWYPLLNGNKM